MKRLAICIAGLVLIAALFNVQLPTKQGINYEVKIYKIPLYIKMIEFIDRDYRYRALSREIVKNLRSDRDKAIAILKWVRSNIKTDIPKGWPIYDDHIWHIIVRGYGGSDQVADVFTTLSAYSGLDAGWAKVFVPGNSRGLILSFVKVGGQWRVFDVMRGVYFTNGEGEIASVEDLLAGRYEKGITASVIDSSGLTYEDYFKYIERYMYDIASRPRKQMPLQRIFYELKDLFKAKGPSQVER